VTESNASRFRRLSEETIAEWRYWKLVRASFVAPDGEQFVRGYVTSPAAVAVVAVSRGEVAMIRQFRPSLNDVFWEIPAGMRDVADEEPIVAARRELAEEVGAHGGRWRQLASTIQAPGLSNAEMTIFFADGVERGQSEPEGPEERAMTVHWLPVEEVMTMVDEGSVVNATAVVGLLAAARMGWR